MSVNQDTIGTPLATASPFSTPKRCAILTAQRAYIKATHVRLGSTWRAWQAVLNAILRVGRALDWVGPVSNPARRFDSLACTPRRHSLVLAFTSSAASCRNTRPSSAKTGASSESSSPFTCTNFPRGFVGGTTKTVHRDEFFRRRGIDPNGDGVADALRQ